MGWVGSRFGVDGWMVYGYIPRCSISIVGTVRPLWGSFSLLSFFISVPSGGVINNSPYLNLAMGD